MKSLLQIDHLYKIYQMGNEKVVALNNIQLDIYAGELCGIFGTSGSGKSTLLNMLAGMEKPSAGNISILGKDITKMSEKELVVFRQRHLGFIFQSYNLLPDMTALENVALPLTFKGMPKKEREEIALYLLNKVGLASRAHHYPSQMSGGQQQRVGIARAFVVKPQVIFADEPTGNLDTATTKEVMETILSFAETFHQTIIMVTHDPNMKQYVSRKIQMLDGKIIANN